jgi:hypothetical protein
MLNISVCHNIINKSVIFNQRPKSQRKHLSEEKNVYTSCENQCFIKKFVSNLSANKV